MTFSGYISWLYFGFVWRTMALKTLTKINGKLKFLYRKKNFPTPTLRRLLCNALSRILIMPAIRGTLTPMNN